MTAPIKPAPRLGTASPIPSTDIQDDEEKADVDSITSEITELRTPEVVKKTPEWVGIFYAFIFFGLVLLIRFILTQTLDTTMYVTMKS